MLEQITEKTVWHKTISEIKLKLILKQQTKQKWKDMAKVATFPFIFFFLIMLQHMESFMLYLCKIYYIDNNQKIICLNFKEINPAINYTKLCCHGKDIKLKSFDIMYNHELNSVNIHFIWFPIADGFFLIIL